MNSPEKTGRPRAGRDHVTDVTAGAAIITSSATPAAIAGTSWLAGLPALAGAGFTLRELRIEDAPTLLAMLSTEEVSRFISPPPTTVEGFERFIAWTHEQRKAGAYACFAVVPAGIDAA